MQIFLEQTRMFCQTKVFQNVLFSIVFNVTLLKTKFYMEK